MSFHTRKGLMPSGIFIPEVSEDTINDKNELIRKSVDAHKDFATQEFDLSEMLKAGIPLDTVNTQVVGTSFIDLPSNYGSEDVSVELDKKSNDKE